jgi:hypothetical protein
MTKCGFCGLEFDPAEAELSCGGCPLAPGCHLIRCPRCGYEMPPESALLRRISAWRNKKKPQSFTRPLHGRDGILRG